MLTRIREVRKAKRLTLLDVAERCRPPTTAQTIGRLETGTRTVSVGWLNRIAAALEVDAADLVTLPDRTDIPVAAILGSRWRRGAQKAAAAARPHAVAGACSASPSKSRMAIIAPATACGPNGWPPKILPRR